jgi:hypothetical protein
VPAADVAVDQHDDAISHAHAGEAMRDQHDGLAAREFLEALEHFVLGARMERGGRIFKALGGGWAYSRACSSAARSFIF